MTSFSSGHSYWADRFSGTGMDNISFVYGMGSTKTVKYEVQHVSYITCSIKHKDISLLLLILFDSFLCLEILCSKYILILATTVIYLFVWLLFTVFCFEQLPTEFQNMFEILKYCNTSRMLALSCEV